MTASNLRLPPALPEGSDVRRLPRQRCFRGAKIIFNASSSLISCTVKDMTDSGARLHLSTTADIPGEFELHVSQMHLTARARLAWRRGRDCGVALARPPHPAPRRRFTGQALGRVSS